MYIQRNGRWGKIYGQYADMVEGISWLEQELFEERTELLYKLEGPIRAFGNEHWKELTPEEQETEWATWEKDYGQRKDLPDDHPDKVDDVLELDCVQYALNYADGVRKRIIEQHFRDGGVMYV